MTDDDAYTAGVAEIKALRERLRRLEEMARTAAPPPADKPASFDAAIRKLARDRPPPARPLREAGGDHRDRGDGDRRSRRAGGAHGGPHSGRAIEARRNP